MTGVQLVICADNQPERLCRMFNQEGITHRRGTDRVAKHDRPVERTGAALGKLHTVIIGGSSAPPATIRWFRDRGVRATICGNDRNVAVGTVGAPPAGWDSMSEDEQIAYMSRPGRSMFGVDFGSSTKTAMSCRAMGSARAAADPRSGVVARYFKEDKDSVDADIGSIPATWG